MIRQHYLSLSTQLSAYLRQLFRLRPVTLTAQRKIGETHKGQRLHWLMGKRACFCCVHVGSIQAIKSSQLIIITFNWVHSESHSQSPGDTQYGQEVTTTLSPSITPAYLITVATYGMLPLGLDHIKPISVCCPCRSTGKVEYSLFKF